MTELIGLNKTTTKYYKAFFLFKSKNNNTKYRSNEVIRVIVDINPLECSVGTLGVDIIYTLDYYIK